MLSADDLQYFLAVAQGGRLVRAAAQLGVDHTTVSRRISALERSVGQRLFDRTARGWKLTEAGQLLIGPAESVDTALAVARERLAVGETQMTGTVRLTCPDGFGAFLLAPALRILNTRHPELMVEVVTATQHLDEGVRGFDVAVTLERPSSSRFVHRPLTDYLLRLYASQEYLDRKGTPARIEELAEHVVIFYVDHLLTLPALRLLQNLSIHAQIQSTNVVAQWQAAASGAGIAPLPQYIAKQDSRLVPILPRVVFRRRYWLTLASEHSRLARVQALANILGETVAARRDDLLG